MLKHWLVVLFIAQTLNVTAQKYAFEKIPDLPYGYNIIQDSQGYILFSDEQGLYKHNGVNSYRLTEEDSLPEDFVTYALTVDHQGYVWAASLKHGIAVIQPDTTIFYNEKNGFLSNKVFDFYKDKQNRLWSISSKGLSLWTDTGFKHYPFNISTIQNILWEDQQGRLLFFYRSANQILEFTQNLKFKPLQGKLQNLLNISETIAVTKDHHNNSWFLDSPKTLVKYDGKQFTKVVLPVNMRDKGYNCLTVDHQNNLWIGTRQGVIQYNGKSFKLFGSREGFTDAWVHQIYQDKEQVIWLLTTRGIYKYYGEQLVSWNEIDGVKDLSAFAFYENTKDTSVWVGTLKKGLLKIKNDQIVERITTSQGLANNWVYSLYKDKKNILWVGTRNGLQKYDGKNFTTITTKQGLAKNRVNIITEDHQGNLWMGHWGKGLTLYDSKTETFKKTPLFDQYRVQALLVDNRQRVWVGTFSGGLYVFDGKNWQQFGEKEGLHHNNITSLTEDYQGNLWVAVFKGGVYLYDHQTFRQFTEKDELPLNTVYSIIFDKRTKQLWLHSNGISMLDLKEFYRTGQFKLRTIGKTEGTLGAFYKDSKDNLWFGNIDGFGRYDTKQDLPKSIPQLHLTSVKLFFKKIEWQKYADSTYYYIPYQLDLPYHQNHLTFAFASLTSRNASKVRYQYKLEGNDQDWSPLSTKNEMTYSNLPAGNYKFLVKALSNEGEWSKTLEYSFCIHPPFWQTTWFYITAALALVTLFVTLVRWRTRRIRQQNILLEHRVEERTQEIQAQSSALKTQTEEIKAQAEELKQINERLVELDDFKQGVTGMIVHDLKNPLNSLLAHAKSPETRQSAQQMLHMVLDILDVQKLESTELQLHWDEFAINLLVRQALDQVTVLARQKNVHFQWSEQQSFVVQADADLIQRVIINLLTNAIKHTPLNSMVYIQLEETHEQKLKLVVTDEGPGVPENLSNKVFDKFFSSGAEKQAMIKSTGLGLTFCKLAMEAHEEAIGVVNATDKGASFWFTLPLVNKEVTINKTQVKQPENDFILTQETKNELLPYAQLLANAQVYEMGKIKSTIDQIKANADSPKAQWKEKMLEATFSMNQEWYDELVKLITNQ